MKRFKIFVCLITLFIVLLSCVACSDDNSSIDDIFSQLIIDGSDSDEPAFAEHIYVIIPNGCSGELSLVARELADGLESKTGILTSLKYDNELTVVPSNSCEILLGDTNRLVSDNALDTLRDGEYLCRWDDGAIVICGRGDSATIVAMERFINEILPISSEYSLMPDEAHFEFMNEYAIERITLNGYDLYDYAFVYPNKNANCEREAAYIIRDFINSQSGYLLDVISEAEVSSKTVRVIKLYGANEKSSIVPISNGITLNGTNAYSLSCVAAELMKNIKGLSDSASGVVQLKYEKNIEFTFVDTAFESAFWFSKPSEQEPFRPNYEIIKYLTSGTVGFCIVGNPNKNLLDDLNLSVKAPIKVQEVSLGEQKMVIAYDEGRVKAVNVTANADKNYLVVDVETSFDEKISYIYIINSDANCEILTESDNVITFYENCQDVKYDGVVCADSGEFKISNEKFSYSLVHRENLRAQGSESVSSEDESKYSCILKTEVLHSEEFLKYALK